MRRLLLKGGEDWRIALAYATNNPRELETSLKVSERLNFSVYVPDSTSRL